ncbi:sulfotransferase ssu-1-like [Ixodes scapularis]|uniref:sulfotransferase ssu-1-like n=1 Tax=Ixodes scapularis TaxID=6945 RepID=UPI001A9ED20B|nr:sulfotransferase ssu-1-like [Ixodes scapularis]
MSVTAKRTPYLLMIDGVPRSPLYKPEAVREALKFEPTANDVILVTHRKSGTHWVKQILLLLLNKGQSPDDFADFTRQTPSITSLGITASDKSPMFLRTHFSFRELKYSRNAKYIYVARNPWDTCVSLYHHVKTRPHYRFQDGTFEEFVDAFIKGRVGQGDHLDHVLSGYALRHEANVLFLTYEKLKEDTAGTILKTAKFLGDPYACMFDQDPGLMVEILSKSSIEFMRKTFHVSYEELREIYKNRPMNPEAEKDWKNIRDGTTACGFVRNGTTGDWRGHFSPELLERMQAWIDCKTRGSDVMCLWEHELAATKLAQAIAFG